MRILRSEPVITRRSSILVLVLALVSAVLVHVPAAIAVPHVVLVPDSARTDTPFVVNGEVLALTQVGDRVLVGGSFTTIRQSAAGPDIAQPYLFAYDVNTGQIDLGFLPAVHRAVRDLEPGPTDDTVYVAGDFNHINGVTRRKIAKLSLDNTVDPTFVANALSYVNSIALDGDTLYVGGAFTAINGVSRSRLAAVDATTGTVDPTFDLPISDGIGVGGWMEVKTVDIIPGSGQLLSLHSARQIAGQVRTGIGLIDVSGETATVLPWRTDHFEDALPTLGGALRLSDAALAPDGSYFVIATSGGDKPPTNDMAIRFPTTGAAGVVPDWVSRHFDSVYAVAISEVAVYVGGHFRFQEAPGSTEPFVGDPNTNYGAGQGGGGAVTLGDEVVAREQVGALNPATGKSMPWNPGANGQEGVLELEVTDRGLLLGHDGNLIDGRQLGRHGFFDFASEGEVSDLPVSEILTPLDGQTVNADEDITISGTGEALAGVATIMLEVQDIQSRLYLRADGTFGDYAQLPVELATPGEQETTWTFSESFPDGNYIVRTRAFDTNDARQVGKDVVKFHARDFAATPPDATIVDPPHNFAEFTSNTLTLTGVADASEGVAAVEISILDELNNAWLQPDGSFGDFVAYPAVLNSPGATTTDWTFAVTLGDGTYRVFAEAVGSAGGRDDAPSYRRYLIYPNNAAPTVTLDAPVDELVIDGSQPITISGEAFDDAGIERVFVQVYDLNAQRGLGFNSSFGDKVRWFPVDVDLPGATATTWSWTSAMPMPLGRYRVRVHARDVVGVDTLSTQRPTEYVTFSVPGDAPPVVDITAPLSAEQTFPDSTISIIADATDDVGVVAGVARLYHYDEAQWVQPDGTLSIFTDIPMTVTNPGATATTLTLSLSVPDGKYRIEVQAFDTAGQHDVLTQWAQDRQHIWLFPGDALPTAAINSPAAGATVIGDSISVGGEIFDDHMVAEVEILIRNTATGKGPRTNGTIGNPQWIAGFVTNPGGDRSNVNYSSIPLPARDYEVRMRAIDNTGRWGNPPTTVFVELSG